MIGASQSYTEHLPILRNIIFAVENVWQNSVTEKRIQKGMQG